jgi:hypothetical protein
MVLWGSDTSVWLLNTMHNGIMSPEIYEYNLSPVLLHIKLQVILCYHFKALNTNFTVTSIY